MTCRDKLKLEKPELVNDRYSGGAEGCPSMYGYLNDPPVCGTRVMSDDDCRRCWDREIPGESSIKDSGDRTEFATGAVRDMREGKGRCDLMPLEVVAEYLVLAYPYSKPVMKEVANFKKTNCTMHLYFALGKFAKLAYDEKDATMFLEVAKHFEEGAKKYGENNWQKGIPVKCYIDSAVRHYLKWLRGDKDEPHDRAFVWNLMCCIWEVDYREKEEKGNGEC